MRFLIGPEAARHRLVHDRDHGRVRAIRLGQAPAAHDGDAHRLEIAGADLVQRGQPPVAPVVRVHAFREHRAREPAVEEARLGQDRALHVGQGADALEDGALEGFRRLAGIPLRPRVEREQQEVRRVEAGIRALRVLEAAQEEAGARRA